MTNPAISQILEHVDTDKWERPAQLVRLVAALQEGPDPCPLGRRLLEAMGRSPRQAAYDHEVLVRLADRDRVLHRWRGTGRRPDAWGVNADLRQWRRVPWITPRRDVMAAFFGSDPDAAVSLWTKRAAQAVSLWTNTPILEALSAAGLSVNLASTTKRDMSTTTQLPGTMRPRYVHNETGPDAPSQFALDSEFTPSLPPSEAGKVREGESSTQANGQDDDPGSLLLAAVAANTHEDCAWIGGVMADRIKRVGRSRPDLLAELLDFTAKLRWVKTAAEAANQIELRLAVLARRPEDRHAQRQAAIDACGRCDDKGWILLPDDTAMRCDHTPHDELDGVGFGL